MPRTIHLTSALPPDRLARLIGTKPDDRYYSRVLGSESVNVLRPDGTPLLLLRKGALPLDVCRLARPALRKAGNKFSMRRKFHSGLIGYWKGDKTAFTRMLRDDWGQCIPFIRYCDALYYRESPAMYDRQSKLALRIPPDRFIADSIFTTATCNTWNESHDAQSYIHDDDGDLGFGVLSALTAGSYVGGLFCLPRWFLAVDLRLGDVMLYDPSEPHGNSAIFGEPGWERVAVILYAHRNNRLDVRGR